ncbi:MAG TPA: HRDC domain-containing protein [Acidimicrobiales bacterium]|nr:HRDC domain-containing protein [Acidimicrobiales bacterium]
MADPDPGVAPGRDRARRRPPVRAAGSPAEPTTTMVVHDAGLEALLDQLIVQDCYGFDTEFHTERTYVPDLALIQIAWSDQVALVDPLAVDPAPLSRLFAGPGLAIAHAAGQDLDVLQAACGTVPARVFDTQIVSGFLGMSTPSLSRLVDQLLGVRLPKADRLSDWLERPIPSRQVTYAVNDVAYLLQLRQVLTERLRALGRLDWALSECDEVLGDRTPARVPEEAWWKLGDIRGMSRRSRGVAQEVAAWRERTAAETNRPRRMVLSDLGLLALSQRPPHSVDELRRTRGVDSRHLAQGRAAEILQAVQRGLALPVDAIRMPTEARESPAPPAAVAVCSGLVRQIADDLDFDQGLLATRADLTQLLSGEPGRLDTGWRRDIVGEPLRRLIAGDVAAAFDRRGHLVLEERSHRHAGPPGSSAIS